MNRSVKVGTSMLGAKENKGNSFVPVEKRVCVYVYTHEHVFMHIHMCAQVYIICVRRGGQWEMSRTKEGDSALQGILAAKQRSLDQYDKQESHYGSLDI